MVRNKWYLLCGLLCVFFLGMRIISLNNRFSCVSKDFGMNESFMWNEMDITPLESHLFSISEFEDYMQMEFSEYEDAQLDDTSKILCLKLKISNQTGSDMEWDKLFDSLGYGFETDTWCSQIAPFLGSKLNGFYTPKFENGATETVWLATVLSKDSFTEEFWGLMNKNDFYYILDVMPNKARICLEQ